MLKTLSWGFPEIVVRAPENVAIERPWGKGNSALRVSVVKRRCYLLLHLSRSANHRTVF